MVFFVDSGPSASLCDATTVRPTHDLDRRLAHHHHEPTPSLRTSGPPDSIQGQRPPMRASMTTSLSLRTISATGLQPFQNIAMTPVSCQPGIAMPSPILQYPTALYPTTAMNAASASSDLKQLTLAQYHAMHPHSAFPTDLSKYKSPFINRNYLELAMLVCNTFRGKLFPCPHCRYVTDRRNNLKRHVSTMHQACEKVLECCGVTFTTKASLREHIMIFHHNGYSCPYCGRRFCRKALLKRHLSVHSGQKDYSCPHCDYATSHKSNLERHKRIHDRLKAGEDCSIIDVEQVSELSVDASLHPSCLRMCTDDESDNDDDELNVTDDPDIIPFSAGNACTQDNFKDVKMIQGDVNKTALNLCTTMH
ncbi:zinc finger protein Gfi-1b-like [Ylistrum balloti]|uniref:zinc finger protein Gfi-1b-like n=1 Tax=Ylistrum balloti TaxID=509963 RepID=UPI0029059C14|nr:zinc finger protein Gfi-1b-like [Ylistrum balloti]